MNQKETNLRHLLHQTDMETVERISEYCPGDTDKMKEQIFQSVFSNPDKSSRPIQIVSEAHARSAGWRGWSRSLAIAAAGLVLCAGIIGAVAVSRPDLTQELSQTPMQNTDRTAPSSTESENSAITEYPESAGTTAPAEDPAPSVSDASEPISIASSASTVPGISESTLPLNSPVSMETQTQTTTLQTAAYDLGSGYRISYEILTESLILANGSQIPAGTVSADVSISGNTGFDGNALLFSLDGVSGVWTDTDSIMLKKGSVLKNALLSGRVSEDGNQLSIACASPTLCSEDGVLFTFYLTAGSKLPTADSISLLCADAVIVETLPAIVNQIPEDTKNGYFVRWYYRAGDADDNTVSDTEKRIDTADAVYILRACEAAPEHELNVLDIDDHAGTWRKYFPAARSAECADANGNTYITSEDAAEVLQYITANQTGSRYTGYAGTTHQDMKVIY